MAKMSSAELKVFIQIKDCTKRAVLIVVLKEAAN
jgi:hypothetical protein